MALYIDDQCILETSYIAGMYKFEGTGMYDGKYLLSVTLRLNDKDVRDLNVLYASQAQRDDAFETISTMVAGFRPGHVEGQA